MMRGNVYPYTVTDDRVGRNKKRKDNSKEFSDEIVLGNLVIMRLFCAIHVQRRFLNKHLRHFHHVSHVSFIPPLVSKRYASRICHLRTSPVQLDVGFENYILPGTLYS
jgi:hypothetical protein